MFRSFVNDLDRLQMNELLERKRRKHTIYVEMRTESCKLAEATIRQCDMFDACYHFLLLDTCSLSLRHVLYKGLEVL